MEKKKWGFLTAAGETFSSMMAVCLVLCAMLVASGAALASEPAAVVKAGSATGLAGETVQVDVSVENPSGMTSFQFDLEYDPSIAVPVDVAEGENIQALSGLFEYNFATPGMASFAWASAVGLNGDGILCTVMFKIKNDAPAKASTPVTVSNLELAAGGVHVLPASAQNGSITVGFVPVPTQAGILAVNPDSGVAGSAIQDITLTYTLGEALADGIVVFKLADGFGGATTSDTISLPGSGTVNLVPEQIGGSGRQIVTVSGVTAASGQSVVLNLVGKTLPAAGTYIFSTSADADGMAEDRSQSPGSGSEAAVFTVDPLLELDVETAESTQDEKITVSGKTTPGASLTINGSAVTVEDDGSFSSDVELALGPNTVTVCSSYKGQVRTVTRAVTREIKLKVDGPADNAVTIEQEVDVKGSVSRGASVRVNGIPVQVNSDGSFAGKAGLSEGANYLIIEASAPGLSPVKETRTVTRHWLDVAGPADGLFTKEEQVTVTGSTTPGASVKVNGVPAAVAGDGSFSCKVALAGGQNVINAESDYEGRKLSASRTVTRGQFDLVVSSPVEDIETREESIAVEGRTAPGASLTINGSAVTVEADGSFSRELSLVPGTNTIAVRASYGGQTAAVTRTVERKLIFEVAEPAENYTTDREKVAVRGKAQPGSAVSINGTAIDLLPDGSFQAEAELEVGENLISIEMNYLGETYTLTRTVTRNLTLYIAGPADGFATIYPSVTVEGRTAPGASVKVNGVSAAVANDGSFTKEVNLEKGANTVSVTASHSGRSVTVSREVTRLQPDLIKVSGDGQAGLPGRTLAKPLVVQVTGPGGEPIPGVTVSFEAASGGSLSPDPDTAGSSKVEITTGIQGRAAAFFTLGESEGDYEVKASLAGIDGAPEVAFTATTVLEPAFISVVQGDGQKAPAGKPVARPVGVKVTTRQGSPVPNCAVEFVVTQGSGRVEPCAGSVQSDGSYLTDAEGIAYVNWILGSAGEQRLSARVAGAGGIAPGIAPVEITATALEIKVEPVSFLEVEFDPGAGKVEFSAVLVDENGSPVEGASAVWEISEGEGSLLAGETTSGQSGAIKNVLYPKSEKVKVSVYPSGSPENKVTFTAEATGFTLGVTVEGYNGYTQLLCLAVNKKTGKSIQVSMPESGSFSMRLTKGDSWEISLDYAPGLVKTPEWVLPPSQTVVMDGDRQIEFALKKAEYKIVGTVEDLDGSPVAGARVILENPLNPGKGTFAVTGGDGKFTLNAQSGAYILDVVADGCQAFAPRSLRVESGGSIVFDGAPVPEETGLQLVLKKNDWAIEGRVTARGSDVEGAVIYAYDEHGKTEKAETGPEGEYSIKLAPGTYHVRGWHKRLGELVLNPQNQAPYDKNPIEVSGNLAGIDLTLPVGRATVSGAVYVGGDLMPGVNIHFKNDQTGGSVQVTTGPDGTYTAEVPAGRGFYRVEAYLNSDLVDTKELTLEAGDRKILVFELAAPCFISGKVIRVIDEGAAGVPGAVVRAKETEKGLDVTAVTDAAGEYCFKNILPGKYLFTVFAPELGSINGGFKTVSSDVYDPDNAYFAFTYPAVTGQITGTVSDENGSGLPGVFVSAVGESGSSAGTYTGAGGEFTLNLTEGDYVLTGSKPGLVQDGRAVMVTVARGETQKAALKMKKSQYRISGKVRDGSGPLPGAFVWAEDLKGGYVNTVAGPDGGYTLLVTPGTWYLGAAASGYRAKKATGGEGETAGQSLVAEVSGDTAKDIVFDASDRIILSPPKVFSIDPATGGVVENPGAGARLNITSSALPAGEDVTVVLKETSSVPDTSTHIPVSGRGVEIKLLGENGKVFQKFAEPVEIKVTYSGEDIRAIKERLARQGVSLSDFDERALRLSYYNPDAREWLVMPAVQDTGGSGDDGGFFIARTDHATAFAVIWPQTMYLQGQQLADVPVREEQPGGGQLPGGSGQQPGGSGRDGSAKRAEQEQRWAVDVRPEAGAEIATGDGAVKLVLPAGAVDREARVSLTEPGGETREAVSAAAGQAAVLRAVEVQAVDTSGGALGSFKKDFEISLDVGSGFGAVGLYYYDPVYRANVPLKSKYDPAAGVLTAAFSRPAVFAAILEKDTRFIDVEGHWAREYIGALAKKSIMRGTGGGAFEPDRPVLRAEIAKMVDLAAAVPGMAGGSFFTDVAGDRWYEPFVSSAAAAGILKGYFDGTFKPGQPVTRAELAAVLVRAVAGGGNGGGSAGPAWTAPDVPAGHWAAGYLAAAVEKGIMSGYPDGTIRPDLPVTRAEAAKMLAVAAGLAE